MSLHHHSMIRHCITYSSATVNTKQSLIQLDMQKIIHVRNKEVMIHIDSH